MEKTIKFKLNGKTVSPTVDGARTLLWVLRTELGLTGTKYGCGEGYCGACTVLVDNEAARSCQLAIQDVEGREVLTIEGLSANGKLHPLQQAFIDHDALQCGYCTPGMLLAAHSLLLRNPQPSRQEIIAGLEDNFCRCGAHTRIIQAVQGVAAKREAK